MGKIRSNPAGNQLSITLTTFIVKERFFCPRMDDSIAVFVTTFVTCSRNLVKPQKPIQFIKPFIFRALEYMGPMQKLHRVIDIY